MLPFVLVGDELDEEAEEERKGGLGEEGRERSVEDKEKAWLNQPESRVGRSPMREEVGG